jgi:small subunit ribosomal protein S20
MANHKATKKHSRQTISRNTRNSYYRKTTRNAIRDLRKLTDPKEATEKLSSTVSMVDKLVKRGIIHRNKAANLKSKLTVHVNKLATAQ